MADLVAHATSPRGDIHLRRHGDGRLELRVNGVFVMDDRETSTERLLASRALAAHAGTGLRVCVGGLGLGFTLDELLAHSRVQAVDVVEIEAALVDWHRTGVISTAETALTDARTSLVTADVVDHLARVTDGAYDVVLLDVDNGPGYLVHATNEQVYAPPFLQECHRALGPCGVLGVWSAADEPQLARNVRSAFASCEEVDVAVTPGGHETTYHLYLGRR